MPSDSQNPRSRTTSVITAGLAVALGTIALTLHLRGLLEDPVLAQGLIGEGLWFRIATGLSATIIRRGDSVAATVPLFPLAAIVGAFSVMTWLAGAWFAACRARMPVGTTLGLWGIAGWVWWLVPLVWEFAETFCNLAGFSRGSVLLPATLPMWHSVMWAGWLTTLAALARPRGSVERSCRKLSRAVWLAMAGYFVCFGAMNWMLYQSLQVPHGDSAMYEEHIWNLLHGKGFRSYLDDGRLFLGEHVQVVHLLFIPLYLLWPSHVLLELLQSAALAAGAIPAFRIALRHTGSRRAATALAIAYLLYFPMQFLDIAIDFKTFRPNSFEIPLFLLALDALEENRLRTMLIWLGLTLLCQEDAATIIAPLGVWMALCPARSFAPGDSLRPIRKLGIGMAVFGVVYVLLVIKVVLPWFRGGADVHFARYFGELGESSGEIISTILRHPEVVLGMLFDPKSIFFGLALVAPLGFLPLLAPGRLAVAAPLFGILCLSGITNSPQHHFHAPLVPVLVWSAAAGLGNVAPLWGRIRNRFRGKRGSGETARIEPQSIMPSGKTLPSDAPVSAASPQGTTCLVRPAQPADSVVLNAACWAALSALLTGFFIGLSPLGISFWDSTSGAYWRERYVPGERAARFPAVLALIPPDSRVASTDYIHPRFTHYTRSYDYSEYRRVPPPDTDYIVIDAQHGTSGKHRPEDIDEYREHPDEWELLPDVTDGYFIVLKRVRPAGTGLRN